MEAVVSNGLQLQIALNAITSMLKVIELLRTEILPKNQEHYLSMAQAPLEIAEAQTVAILEYLTKLCQNQAT